MKFSQYELETNVLKSFKKMNLFSDQKYSLNEPEILLNFCNIAFGSVEGCQKYNVIMLFACF